LIRRAQQIAVAIFMDECARFDITPVQYSLLTALRHHPGADATRLSALIAFDRSTLGNVIKRLESKGLLRRQKGRDDKRLKCLELTPAGTSLLSRIEKSVDRVQARILAPLRPADREKLVQLLKKLVELNNEESRAPLRLSELV
jgi:DNA-binding MarR family transcriptional regulator